MDTNSGANQTASVATKNLPSPIAHYVVGYFFDARADNVLLIRKNKPEYLKGKWNGPGGKVEPGENIVEAMHREMCEETSVHLPFAAIEHYINMHFYASSSDYLDGKYLIIDFFTGRTNAIMNWRQTEDELVRLWPLNEIMRRSRPVPLVSNLHWMLPYALDKHRSMVLHCEEVQQ